MVEGDEVNERTCGDSSDERKESLEFMRLKIITAACGSVIIDDVIGILVLEEEDESIIDKLPDDYEDFLRNFPNEDKES